MIRITFTNELGLKQTVIGTDKIKLQQVILRLQKEGIEFKVERLSRQ